MKQKCAAFYIAMKIVIYLWGKFCISTWHYEENFQQIITSSKPKWQTKDITNDLWGRCRNWLVKIKIGFRRDNAAWAQEREPWPLVAVPATHLPEQCHGHRWVDPAHHERTGPHQPTALWYRLWHGATELFLLSWWLLVSEQVEKDSSSLRELATGNLTKL